MRVRMKVEDGNKIARRFQMMSEEMQRKHMREIALAAAEPIRAEASRLAPRMTGNLSENIDVEVEKQTKSRIKLKIGPTLAAWYGRLVEEGHAKVAPGQRKGYRSTQKRGDEWSGGHVAPKPFLRPAFDTKQEESQTVAAAEIKRRLKLK